MGKTKKQFKKFLVGQDIYGYSIGVNYRGSEEYKTRLGTACTFFSYILMLFNLTNLLIAFIDGSRQEEKISTIQFDRLNGVSYNLTDLGVNIQYFTNLPIEPEIGRFIVE